MGRYPSPTIHPSRGSWPVLLSVPHSGRDYDSLILGNAVQGRRALETLEDPLVDRLAWRAIALGVGAVVQSVPRAVIDCNRDEDELDPAAIAGISSAPVGARARHGLGLVPSRSPRHGPLWRCPIDRAELALRIKEVHRPYHRLLAEGLDSLRSVHGEVLLLDCHSMPSRPGKQDDIVIGDRHGASSAAWLSGEAARLVRAAGFTVALNDPYAGGAIITRHGSPPAGTHALQLEIDRSLYLDRNGRSAGPGFDRVAMLIATLASGLGETLAGLRQAAE